MCNTGHPNNHPPLKAEEAFNYCTQRTELHATEKIVNYCDVIPALGGSAAESFPPHSYSDYSPKEFFPPAAAPLPHPAPHPCDYSVLSHAYPPGPPSPLRSKLLPSSLLTTQVVCIPAKPHQRGLDITSHRISSQGQALQVSFARKKLQWCRQ